MLCRGYWPSDSRTLSVSSATAVSRHLMSLSWKTFLSLDGFSPAMSPLMEDIDLCLRAAELNYTIRITGQSTAISLESIMAVKDTTNDYTSSIINPLALSHASLQALSTFSERWKDKQAEVRRKGYLTDAKLTWVIHCGGSQGLEAATILQTLYK
jgi:hypothetical protein